MTPNDLAAEIYLALVRERIAGGGIEKIKARALEEAARKACECSDIFWNALGEYARQKGYVPMPETQPPQPAIASTGASPAPRPAA